MTSSTGNHNGPRLAAIPDLIYPAIAWSETDYARLHLRLDMFDDFIVLSKFLHGQKRAEHLVDPAEVAAALAGLNLNSGLLPRECLFWGKLDGQDRLGVHIPPQVWLATVRDEEQAWRIPLPGLIFTGCEYNYSVWAIKDYPGDDRTPLYMAPCPNVIRTEFAGATLPSPRPAQPPSGRRWISFSVQSSIETCLMRRAKLFPTASSTNGGSYTRLMRIAIRWTIWLKLI